ncbi:hypothetical protein OIE68_16770 [Nocardia vinacea]|uniref:hypothetical protein n=1 Tax=Nocardia vinacea TaxID=96468 RepID=UPI002E14DEC5|nr:hypothetical protein OIE68_16770 [Nocardia vinacea]
MTIETSAVPTQHIAGKSNPSAMKVRSPAGGAGWLSRQTRRECRCVSTLYSGSAEHRNQASRSYPDPGIAVRPGTRREELKIVPSTPKRNRNPAVSLTLDSELKERVEQALQAVDSTYREHVIAFLRWFIRDTDELPARPDYRLPHFPYGE